MKHSALALGLIAALCASSAEAQTFKTLVTFSGTGGAAIGQNPGGSLTLSGTTLYGMTSGFGQLYLGNIFSVGMDGSNYRNLVSFTGTGGSAPGAGQASLTLSGSTLYGMSAQGGANRNGNVFSVGADGTNYRSLLSFTGTGGTASGLAPQGSLTLNLDGTMLFGMTYQGGAKNDGNVFSVATDGTNYQNLLSFTGTSGLASGSSPDGSLTLSGTTLYGMTYDGGTSGYGNIFSEGTDGTSYRNLLSFTGTGGAAIGGFPQGSLTLDGTTLYGVTAYGGAGGNGNVFSIGIGGTNYHNLLTLTGSGGAASGRYPYGSLLLSGTSLYGMTQSGGVDRAGNIFSVGIDGSGYQDLYDFTAGGDGGFPHGDLTLSGGTLFGMTYDGGIKSLNGGFGGGVVFAYVLPAAPTPEPGALALVGCGAAAIAMYRWRRMRRRRPS